MRYIAVVCKPSADVNYNTGGAYAFIGEDRGEVIQRALVFYNETMGVIQRNLLDKTYVILLGELTDEVMPSMKYSLKSLRA